MDFTHHTIDLRPFKYSFSYSNPSRVFFINKVISASKVSDASEVCKCSPMQKKKKRSSLFTLRQLAAICQVGNAVSLAKMRHFRVVYPKEPFPRFIFEKIMRYIRDEKSVQWSWYFFCCCSRKVNKMQIFCVEREKS